MAALALLAPFPALTEGVNGTCVLTSNYYNAQYTLPLLVGTPPQLLNAIPDSGSYELIMTSVKCDGCKGHPLFNMSSSVSFVGSDDVVNTAFGQGDVTSVISYDRVQLGELVAPKQSILLMTNNGLRNFEEAAYDAVMGMGRESRARSYSDDLSLMASLHAPVTGVCIGQHDNEAGRLQVGAEVPGLQYVELPVAGESYWAITLEGLGLVSSGAPNKIISGCEGGCQAIVDSGTSLIALPTAILNRALSEIGHIASDCSNIDRLPKLRFSAGGHHFDLPPQLYVSRMEVEDETSHLEGAASHRMPWQMVNISRRKAVRGANSLLSPNSQVKVECVPLFMEMDASLATSSPSMILGLPFLRGFAARFDRTAKTIGLGEIPFGSSICTHCGATHSVRVPSSLRDRSIILDADKLPANSLIPPQLEFQRRPTILKRSHLREPSWSFSPTESAGQ